MTKTIQPTTVPDEMDAALRQIYEDGDYPSLSAVYREAFGFYLKERHGVELDSIHPQRGGNWRKENE